ncbi:hypothetical protein [Streptomyces botrytidirepellens]|uniref:Uncharacterized protein n=1 Tax=Streptomyces botrytidirepellens TaxID=2486417 RepID=A0A3M8XB14_9ACTN|nr:hypothetical protein [Streptomyces botrytidirepellens]RNG37995.1 hypothetical protein EEJ42_02085 [Streptomyces botrytidirepellens]
MDRDQGAMPPLDGLAQACEALVEAHLERNEFQGLGQSTRHAISLNGDSASEVAAFRQTMWMLMCWLVAVRAWVPETAVPEAIAWIERRYGRQAAASATTHATILDLQGAPLGEIHLDEDQPERIASWAQLLAGLCVTQGDGSVSWLRQFDPPEPDAAMLAWLEERERPGWRPRPWPPDPRQLPDIRRKLIAYLDDPETRWERAQMAEEGVVRLIPRTDSPGLAGDLLTDYELQRLAKARLYVVDPDMCQVAARKAARPRTAPISAHRVPAPFGFLLFTEPMPLSLPGQSGGPRGEIVAASWGRWDPSEWEDGWWQVAEDGTLSESKSPSEAHWWITLYEESADDGEPGDRPQPPMEPHQPYLVHAGNILAQTANEGQLPHAARAVIACWDLITQERIGKPLTETTTVERKPSKTRADRRRGIEDDGTVHLVTIRGRAAPSPDQPQAALPHQRTTINYQHRWTVQEHSRSHCMNPAGHAENNCNHEDITILEFVKGPAGAPFLRRDIVHILRKIGP